MAALRVQSSPVLTKVNEFPRELVKTRFFALRARLHADRSEIDQSRGEWRGVQRRRVKQPGSFKLDDLAPTVLRSAV